MLVYVNIALSETEGLKSNVDSFNNMFSRLESAYKALGLEHEAIK